MASSNSNMKVPGPSGPAIWLDLDQKALDDAYDQTVYAPNFAQLNGRREKRTALLSASASAPSAASPMARRRSNNSTSTQPRGLRSSVLILIYGGAWRTGLARDFADGIEAIVRAGGHCIIPDFVNVVDAGGSLFPMIDQVRRVIAWTVHNAETFGGDHPGYIYSAVPRVLTWLPRL